MLQGIHAIISQVVRQIQQKKKRIRLIQRAKTSNNITFLVRRMALTESKRATRLKVSIAATGTHNTYSRALPLEIQQILLEPENHVGCLLVPVLSDQI